MAELTKDMKETYKTRKEIKISLEETKSGKIFCDKKSQQYREQFENKLTRCFKKDDGYGNKGDHYIKF